MRKILAGIICSSLLAFFIITWRQTAAFLPEPGQEAVVAVMADGGFCLAENRGIHSYLYQIDNNGRIHHFFPADQIGSEAEILDICTVREQIYFISRRTGDNDRSIYSFVKLDQDFALDFVYECGEFSEENHFSRLFVEDNRAYLTFLSRYREEAMVYGLDMEDEEKKWRPVLKRTAEMGRSYVEAVYRGGQLEASLDYGTEMLDKSTLPGEIQEVTADSSVYIRFLSLILYRNLVCFLLFLALFGIPFLGILNRRSFALQRFSVMEMIFIMLLLSGMCYCFFKVKENRLEDRFMYVRAYIKLLEGELGNYAAGMNKAEFYQTEEYAVIHRKLMEHVEQEGNQGFISDVCIVSFSNVENLITVSAVYSAGFSTMEVYGMEPENLLEEGKKRNGEVSGVCTIKGQNCGVFIIPDRNALIAEHALMIIMPLKGLAEYEQSYRAQIIGCGIVIFFTGTILLAGITWLLSVSMRRFSKTMEAVARGQRSFSRPYEDSNEMNLMWNSLSELNKNVEQAEYDRLKLYQAYSRFAPKQIEKILGKDSVIDIKPGDFKNIRATLGLVSADETGDMELEECREQIACNMRRFRYAENEHGGILIDADCRLTAMKLLFLGQAKQAVMFGIDLMHAWGKDENGKTGTSAVLFHRSDYIYGVVGTDKEPVTYLTSAEMTVLQDFAWKLKEHGVKMAVTETAAASLDSSISIRYIGFIPFKAKSLKLYEVLDAYEEKERRIRLRHDGLFQKAIELYYKNDFYLARSIFTEIVKGCPADQIAKWYLFTCEAHLNEIHTENIQYGLFAK